MSLNHWIIGELLLALVAWGAPAHAGPGGEPCARTARLQHQACRAEVSDDTYTELAICLNTEDETEREECIGDARDARKEGRGECKEQREARLDLCEDLGGGRYDPEFDPADFDDDFTNLTFPNPYFPLVVGNDWSYVGGTETIDVTVTSKTKLIEGVTCVVVNDVVEDDGELIEDTDDWYGQMKNGDTIYMGEVARNFETFDGDSPDDPELVDLEGSWKEGRDGDRGGLLISADPDEGDIYRQEWKPGDAEDVAVILATDYGYGNDAELDAFVPQALAELLCDDDCLVTKEFTPIEPEVFERKYYAPGIGLFLEVNPEDGEIVQLVGCNVDALCAALPAP